LNERGIPFSVLGNNVVGEWRFAQHDVVLSDDIQGSYDLTRYLISLGHRHIWFVGDIMLPWFARCAQGYARAMEEVGLQPRYSGINSGDLELGYLGTKSILSQGSPVTAIFAGSDQVAVGVYKALREFGVPIPDSIAVVGFNDTEGSILHPALTTVSEFPEQLGRHLAKILLSRVTEPDSPSQQVTIPTQLIRRESCFPLPSAASVRTPVSVATEDSE